jgi:outer membrane protein assembly factor BamB
MKQRSRMFFCLIAICITTTLVVCAFAGDWPGWRGDGTGISAEKPGIPLTWSTTENVRWSVSIPGYGWSMPIVTGNKVFVTTATSEKQPKIGTSRIGTLKPNTGAGEEAPKEIYRWEVYCLDATTGETLWKRTAAERNPPFGTHIQNTFASETPITDGERVYVYFGQIGVFCYDLAGNLIWSRDVGAYKTFSNWGTSSSPALDDGRLFVQFDNEQSSFIVALDTKSGKELWRITREEKSTWSTPIIWRNKVRTELVAMGGNYNRGYDPATGKELWRCESELKLPVGVGDGSGRRGSGGCKSTPVADKEMLYLGMSGLTPGYEQGPLWAIKAGASGDILISVKTGEKSNKWVAWFRDESGPHFTSPLLYNGRLYVFPAHAKDKLTCMDAQTGEIIYRETLTGSVGFYCSPWAYDGKIYCTDDNCNTFIIEPGPKLKVIAQNSLNEMSWSTPAIANGAFFIRTIDHLYCIAGKK